MDTDPNALYDAAQGYLAMLEIYEPSSRDTDFAKRTVSELRIALGWPVNPNAGIVDGSPVHETDSQFAVRACGVDPPGFDTYAYEQYNDPEYDLYSCYNCEKGSVAAYYDICWACQDSGTSYCLKFSQCHGLVGPDELYCPACASSDYENRVYEEPPNEDAIAEYAQRQHLGCTDSPTCNCLRCTPGDPDECPF